MRLFCHGIMANAKKTKRFAAKVSQRTPVYILAAYDLFSDLERSRLDTSLETIDDKTITGTLNNSIENRSVSTGVGINAKIHEHIIANEINI